MKDNFQCSRDQNKPKIFRAAWDPNFEKSRASNFSSGPDLVFLISSNSSGIGMSQHF